MRLVVLLLIATALLPCMSLAATQRLSGSSMGTTWTVTAVTDADADTAGLREGIEAELDKVVAQMSTWEPGSDISRFNRASAGAVQVLPDGFFQVLDAALRLAKGTGGAFDPTVGPLVNLWGFGPNGSRDAPPGPDAIAAVRVRTGWHRLSLDRAARTAVQPGGLQVDLSSIAKGFAVDQVAAYLVDSGIRAFLVEVGGELHAQGRKPDGAPWRIAIESTQPDDADSATAETVPAAQIVVALDDLSVATSGDYRHYFERDGRRYSHTIDPRTGYPVAHGLASVTVLHEDCMQADALATAMTVLGPDDGYAYALRHGVAALFVLHEGHLHDGNRSVQRMTPGFTARLLSP
jgi:thiamine biosynthesis lipoprotein